MKKGLFLLILILINVSCSPKSLPSSSSEQDLGSAILARARIWLNPPPVPYGGFGFHNNPPYFQGYKTDCSGFVSFAWDLPSPGIGTNQFVSDGYASVVSISDLQPGDVLNNNQADTSGHMVIFVKWLDAKNHKFDSYDLNTDPGYTSEKTYTLVQIPNTNDWTISELDKWAQGPYQAQRLVITKSAIVLGPGPVPASSPMSSTIVAGNVQSNDCSSSSTLDRSNGEEVLRWLIDGIDARLMDRLLCLAPVDTPLFHYNYAISYIYENGGGMDSALLTLSEYSKDLHERLSSSSVQCNGINRYVYTDTNGNRLERNSILTSGWSPPWNFPLGTKSTYIPDNDNAIFVIGKDSDGIWNLIELDLGMLKINSTQWDPCN